MSPVRFSGKTVLVTGGGSGIGRAVALAFAREGAAVAVAARSPEPLRQTVEAVEDEGGKALAVTADITDSQDVARLVEEAAAWGGRLDIAVNGAGVLGAFAPVADVDEADWARTVDTNLTGTWLCMKHEIARMRRDGAGGVIVNIASNFGAHRRFPGLGPYVASKAAVSALTRAAALDHIGEGIRINAISPGPTATAMSLRPGETEADRAERMKDAIPIGRVGELHEIVSAALWLASPDAGFTVGHDMVIDGGATA